MIKYLIWDFDGTLYDTYPGISDIFKKTFESLGIEAEKDEIMPLLHKSFAHVYDFYSKRHGMPPETIRQRFIEFKDTMRVEDTLPFKGAEEILSLVIERGGANFIYTNRDSSIYPFLEHRGYGKYFKEVITSDDGLGVKPSPDSINHIIEKYGLDRGEVLMVGDRVLDIESAVNAGVKSCYFNTHGLPIEIEADIYVESLEELASILSKG
jgi:HAD superfamily hydrolase (TIGR01549 family)